MTQKTDRELLELAAKAAGIEYESRYVNHAGDEHRGLLQPSGIANIPNKWWNPLTDDGDALRLAVNLHISVRYTWDGENDEFDAVFADGRGRICCEEQIGFFKMEQIDENSATRRAIVRAAAEIGKAME